MAESPPDYELIASNRLAAAEAAASLKEACALRRPRTSMRQKSLPIRGLHGSSKSSTGSELRHLLLRKKTSMSRYQLKPYLRQRSIWLPALILVGASLLVLLSSSMAGRQPPHEAGGTTPDAPRTNSTCKPRRVFDSSGFMSVSQTVQWSAYASLEQIAMAWLKQDIRGCVRSTGDSRIP